MTVKIRAVTLLTTLLFISGCSSVDPYTGEKKSANSTTGSVIGAVAGAAIGAATSSNKDRKKGILTGLAAGAALGGGVGHYMDVQESKLREQLANSDISVTRNGDQIILNMPNSITFDTDSSILKPIAIDSLGSVSQVVKEFDKTNIIITGHTDNTGRASYNQLLSEKRAQSVANQMMNTGITHSRVAVNGEGATHPLVSNNTPTGRAQNRRVEITLAPSSIN